MSDASVATPSFLRHTSVTRSEIEEIEKILNLIDRNNQTLGTVSQWVLVWTRIRDLSLNLCLNDLYSHPDIKAPLEQLLIESRSVGLKLLGLCGQMSIPQEQLKLVVNCDYDSLSACIDFLNDKLIQWFDLSLSEADAKKVWELVLSEPERCV